MTVEFHESTPIAPLTAQLFLLICSIAAGAAAGAWVGRQRGIRVAGPLLAMTLFALVGGRFAHVVLHFDTYRGHPIAVLRLVDGGVVAWAALACAVLAGGWCCRRRTGLIDPLAAAVLVASFAWLVAGGPTLLRLRQEKTLPAQTLTTLRGAQSTLGTYANGKPMVVNLWASWCAPCIEEMPLLARAQDRYPDVTFVFVNQGEDAGTVAGFLARHHSAMANVLLDADRAIGVAVGSTAVPVSLFYDAQGRLHSMHVGALSEADLSLRLAGLRNVGPPSAGMGEPRLPQ